MADALRIQVPTLTIDTAVMMRHMSGYKEEREVAGQYLQGPTEAFKIEKQAFIDQLENSLYCAGIITYAQGMALLRRASETYGYNLNLETVARVWTGGCIIRAALLEEIQAAYQVDADMVNLLVAPSMNKQVQLRQSDWRTVVCDGVYLGIPVPGLMSALAYWDAYRSSRLPANLIMAQRDFFGAHSYERVDEQGTFHSNWSSD